ncbi:MAG: beta-eliminating lyase-related protein [Rectinemataceae bacterium]|jgi:threonine aldolase
MPIKSFASDNNSGACAEAMQALSSANSGHALGYGDDPWTEKALATFKREFGPSSETFFVLNGTGANILALSLVAGPGLSVLCSDVAHIAIDETGASEAALGCKVRQLESREGKVLPEALREALTCLGFIHQSQPSCLSLSQPTELGTLYSPEELAELSAIAREAGLAVHVDGARIANAAVALGLGFRELCTGVDLLSFGGMKNGIAFGEAVVVLKHELAARAPYLRKTRLQLASKMRFISAQYEAYLSTGAWERNARAANAAARRLGKAVAAIGGIELVFPVSVNALFARMPAEAAVAARRKSFFYDWEGGLQRWMTSFDTTDSDVDEFAAILRDSMSERGRIGASAKHGGA